MASAIASGVKPEQGLSTAIIAGLLISVPGGPQVQIGGPAGAFIIIVYRIIERYGLANLLIATSLAGVLIFVLVWFRLGALVRYVPLPIVIGFTNGIAVSQLRDLFGLQIPGKLPGAFVAPLASSVPLAVLAGILLFVARNMGEWHEFARLRHFSTQYRTILLGIFLLTVIFDLSVAVEVGLALACVFFIYRMSTPFKVLPHTLAPGEVLPPGVQVFELYGSPFFGAAGGVGKLEAQVEPGPGAPVLADVNEQPLSLLRRSGLESIIGADHIVPSLNEVDAVTR